MNILPIFYLFKLWYFITINPLENKNANQATLFTQISLTNRNTKLFTYSIDRGTAASPKVQEAGQDFMIS